MKHTKFWFLLLLFYGAILGSSYATYAAGLEVHYDRERGRLSVQAEQVSLTQVLGQIAAQTGVEILMDPSIKKTISMSLQGQPLEKALKQIARGLSYVMLYDGGKKRNPTQVSRLTTMKLLPQGKQNSPNLVPVAVLNARAGRYNGPLGDGDFTGSRGGNRHSPKLSRKPKYPTENKQKALNSEEAEALQVEILPKTTASKPGQVPSLLNTDNHHENIHGDATDTNTKNDP